MLVGDIIYNDDFDANLNYAIYDCPKGCEKVWRESDEIWSTLKNGYGKPLDKILDRQVGYITISDNILIIEAK